jgi:beta-lactamase superfamily II metal-dependent hydrolase
MISNDRLRIHVINVGHGDSILIEFPDDNTDHRRPRFGLVDAGGEDRAVKEKTRDYIREFITYRLEQPPSTDPDAEDYVFEFICLTHPHADHLYGMLPVLEHFCGDNIPMDMRPRQFWDCGFRYNTVGYLAILQFVADHPEIQFIRMTSGTEFHFGNVEVLAVAPSIDMRNRYDTYGVELNDASIVLRVSYNDGVAILTGDAHFDSWGKVCEEFPRKKHIIYPPDSRGRADMRDPNREDIAFLSRENQLNCQLLKVSHHGSKRGSSYEYIEKLSPSQFVISCDENEEYSANWKHKFPHPITRLIIGEEADRFQADETAIPSVAALGDKIRTTAVWGSLVYRIAGSRSIRPYPLGDGKHDRVRVADFAARLQ